MSGPLLMRPEPAAFASDDGPPLRDRRGSCFGLEELHWLLGHVPADQCESEASSRTYHLEGAWLTIALGRSESDARVPRFLGTAYRNLTLIRLLQHAHLTWKRIR